MAIDKKLLEQQLPNGGSNTQTAGGGGAAQTAQASQQNKPTGAQNNQSMTATSSSVTTQKYSGMNGLNPNTQQQMGKYQQGYTPSAAVQQAQAYLDNLLNNKPGDFASNYTQQLNDIYGQIMNRGPFKYDLNADMLYQQAKDQYMLTGQQAMMDTMGQAAALTGGYGSSYASTAGNQAYQQHLTALNNMVPELYDRAAAQWAREGDELYNKYSLTAQADATDYDRYLAALDQYNNDRAFAQGQYDMLYGQDYGQFADARNYWAQMAAQENAEYWSVRNQAYQTAMAMLQKGKMPSADMLNAAGISAADAKKWIPTASGGGGGGSSNSSSGTKKGDTTDAQTLKELIELELKKKGGSQAIYKPTSAQFHASAIL